MIRLSAARRLTPLLLAALVAGACGSSSSNKSALAAATLNGSGSTLQKNFDDAAIAAFAQQHSNITINYNATGSGQGQTELEGQIVDFAGSDVPIATGDMAKLKGGAILYFPTVASPITVSYKLTGTPGLRLSGSTLAKVFSRTVKAWNDPAIAGDNPGVTLPSTAITVAVRSDGSGTTANFTEFLKKAGGSDWTLGTAKSISWSKDTQAGKGNPGVVNIVKNTEGAIGYIDYSDAKASGLSFASIKNAAGTFVTPSLDAASTAIAGTTPKPNLVYDPINASGDQAYPITSPTYIIVYAKQPNAAKGAALKAFLSFIDGPDGQKLAGDNDYAMLPSDLAGKALAQIGQITIG